MKTARRFLVGESGMTLPLAMIMIVLMGVMGAGLLAFTNRDINTVAEENRGQRSFEVADAGVGVAKQQLTSDCAGDANCGEHYDGFEDAVGSEDLQWSLANDGVTVNDLDGDGNDAPGDSLDNVNVTIHYSHGNDHFKVVSEGTYTTGIGGVAKRKVEAKLVGVGGNLGGAGIGHPMFYTPSAITIEGAPTEGDITLSGMSMFSEQDIIIEGLPSTRPSPSTEPEGRTFKTDYEDSNIGVFKVPGTNDFLDDWYSPGFPIEKRGDWNTQPRTGVADADSRIGAYANSLGCARNRPCVTPGFAAEGKMCGVPYSAVSDYASCGGRTSIADGNYVYDCTTGPVPASVTPCARDAAAGEVSRGNHLTFVEKQPTVDPTTGTADWGDNEFGTITYPFPKLQPNDRRLKRTAQEQQRDGTGGYYYEGCTPPWDTILNGPGRDDPLTDDQDVIFIDAGGCDTPIEMDWGGGEDGIMVVWCGETHHTNNTRWNGIHLNLIGNGEGFGSSNCEGDVSKGVYTVDGGSQMYGWLYSEGGSPDTRAGIKISSSGTDTSGQGTALRFRAGATWNFLDETFSTPSAPTGFSVKSWRELYE